MEKERALELVKAINATVFCAEGVIEEPPEDPGASLLELIEAAHMVRDMGPQPTENETTRIYMFPADRLVAAAYATWKHQGDPIDSMCPKCVTKSTTVVFLKTSDVMQK